MKIGICDDDPKTREQLNNLCHNLGYIDTYQFDSGEELLSSDICPSLTLVFLDIEMNGMTGIEVKNILEQKCPFTLIIFNTSHEEQIKDAFGRNVISFISKPFSEISIKTNIERAAALSCNFLPIKINDEVSVPCQDILYVTSEHKYSIFYTNNGNSFSSRKALKDWAKELEEFDFYPISRGIIINLKHYKKIQDKKVVLYNGMSFPISRRYSNLLKLKFDEYTLKLLRCR